MRLSFQHANPEHGNESFLLRFGTDSAETQCVLVDAGSGVDLDALLKPTDQLAAICLTHAHLDHYGALADVYRDEAPVVASPATATVLSDVFDVAAVEYDVNVSETVASAIEPVTTWTEICPGVAVHPVPAGHVPGAVGFLFRVEDEPRSQYVLATGDFTRRRAGGFPGFDPSEFVEVDALFLTGATNEEFTTTITDAVGTALTQAHSGSRTLVTASGLVGAQLAYVLANGAAAHDLQIPIRVVGQVAKLYDDLDYSCPHVDSIPQFGHTDECLEPGAITIAGPEVPRERSSGRLFGVLKQDPNACVIQIIGSGTTPLTDGKCTIHSHTLSNHPSRATLVDVHDALAPTSTVITHTSHGAKGAFNDLDSVVWGAGDTDEYVLYDGGRWLRPPWMPGETITGTGNRSLQQFAGSDLLSSFSVPSLDRHTTPDLAAEGVDTDRLASMLHRRPGRPTPTVGAEPTPDEPVRQMTDNEPNTADTDASDATPAGLVRTTGPEVGDEPDPWLQEALENGDLTETDIRDALETSADAVAKAQASDGEAADTSDADSPAVAKAQASDGEAADTSDADPSTDSEGTDQDETEATASTTETADEPADTTPAAQPDGATNDAATTTDADAKPEPDSPTRTLQLSPVSVALAARMRSEHRSLSDIVTEAIDGYVAALLAGEASGDDDERFSISFERSPAATDALSTVNSAEEPLAELVERGIAATIAEDAVDESDVAVQRRLCDHLDAIVRNDAYVFDSCASVAEAAVAWYVASETAS